LFHFAIFVALIATSASRPPPMMNETTGSAPPNAANSIITPKIPRHPIPAPMLLRPGGVAPIESRDLLEPVV
jgi:hypothetical protein